MAIRFDEAGDRLTHTATSPPDPAVAITITGWAFVSVDTDTFATFCRLFTGSNATTATIATSVSGVDGPNYFTGGGSITASIGLPVGEWRKWAITCVGTDGALYVAPPSGATEVDVGTVSGAAAPTGLTLGGRSPGDSSESLNGRLAYVRIWSAVLTQVEIEAEWGSSTAVRGADLWADYPLSGADDLLDHSGNGRHLTAGVTPVTTEDGPPIGGGDPSGITPDSITPTVLIGEPTMTVGAVTVAPSTISASTVVGAPGIVVDGPVIIPGSIPGSAAIGAPTVTAGEVDVLPVPIPTAAVTGMPTLAVAGARSESLETVVGPPRTDWALGILEVV